MNEVLGDRGQSVSDHIAMGGGLVVGGASGTYSGAQGGTATVGVAGPRIGYALGGMRQWTRAGYVGDICS